MPPLHLFSFDISESVVKLEKYECDSRGNQFFIYLENGGNLRNTHIPDLVPLWDPTFER